MKPKNFPEKKNQRRINALKRLKDEHIKERTTLVSRIRLNARDTRTKKDRRARGLII